MNKWAINYDKCIECGQNNRPHAAKGLCERCYQKDEYFRKHGSHLERAKAIITQLTELEKAYLAGFIDGEGCITAECPAIDGHNKPKAARVRIMLAQTNKPIIEWLHVKLGGTVCKKQAQGNHKASYNWVLNGQRATLLLIAIHPHLRVKREQAEVAIAFGKVRLGRTSIPITGEEKNQLAELKRRLMALNQRGTGKTIYQVMAGKGFLLGSGKGDEK